VSTLTLMYKLLLSSLFIAHFASVYTAVRILPFFVETRTRGRYKKANVCRWMLLITRGRCNKCQHIFQKSVTTKYLMILHYADTNVSRTSNLCGTDVAVGYWSLDIHMCMTSWAMILMLNFIDIVSQDIRWEAHTWPYNTSVLIK